MQLVTVVNQFLAILTIISEILVALIILSLLIKTPLTKRFLAFLQRNSLLFAFIIALIATLGSLFFSEIAKFDPCKLCWYQRILMYPQVLLLGGAYLRKEKNIAFYSMIMSIGGAIIAFYHYLLQIGRIGELLPCSAVGYSVSCSQKFVLLFGYITIPMMALSAFLLIIALLSIQHVSKETKKK